MARKKKNTVDYFPHYIEGGKAMFIIETKYKNDGYATWFKILERLGKSENHYIDLSDLKEKMYLASKCNIEHDKLQAIINDLVELGKFDKYLWKENIIWSQDFVDSIADVYKRRNIEMPTIKIICEQLSIKCEQKYLNVPGNAQSKVKYSKVNKSIKYFDDKNLNKKYQEWVKYRTEIRKTLNDNTIKRQQTFLNKYTPDVAIQIIDKSLVNQYQGLFPLKEKEINNEHPAGKLHVGKKDYSKEKL